MRSPRAPSISAWVASPCSRCAKASAPREFVEETRDWAPTVNSRARGGAPRSRLAERQTAARSERGQGHVRQALAVGLVAADLALELVDQARAEVDVLDRSARCSSPPGLNTLISISLSPDDVEADQEHAVGDQLRAHDLGDLGACRR